MARLHISADLSLPLDFVTQTQAILAIKRVGKTYTASVQAEELLRLQQQIVAIDVTGAWHGLRSNAAGDGVGFSIPVFGGDHGDLPLEEHAGEVLAEAIVSERFSAVIDLSLFRKAQAQRFLAIFFETLYRKNRDAMHLFMDEADFYAPQKPFGEEARTLGAVNDIVRRGGIRGIGCTLITQRPAVLNKDVLTMCGILTCLRISHPIDMKAVREWVAVHGNQDVAKNMEKDLPSLPKGTAYVWASGWPTEEGIFQKVKIRQRLTFDSGATPKPGQSARAPKVVAQIDIQQLGQKIASTVEQHKANDPALLKQRISQLERELAAKPKTQAVDVDEAVNAALTEYKAKAESLARHQSSEFQRLLDGLGEIQGAVAGIVARLRSENKIYEVRPFEEGGSLHVSKAKHLPPQVAPRVESVTLKDWQPKAIQHTGASVNVNPSNLSGPERRILNAIAWLNQVGIENPEQTAVAFVAGYTIGGGAFNNPRGSLNVKGLVQYVSGDKIRLTDAGRANAETPARALNTAELQRMVLDRLPGPEQKILTVLIGVYPRAISNEECAERSGYTHGGGAYNNPRGRLKTLGLIEYPGGGTVKAKPLFFLE